MTDPLTFPVSSGLVQVIQLSWDKSARGGQGARKRNSVPLAFEVHDGHLRDVRGQFQAQVLFWGMGNDFSEPLESRYERVPLDDGYDFHCVMVSANPEGLSVRYRWDADHGGAPARPFLDIGGNGELLVRPGEWMRISYNGRFSDADTGTWWYKLTTVNVAAFARSGEGWTSDLRQFRFNRSIVILRRGLPQARDHFERSGATRR